MNAVASLKADEHACAHTTGYRGSVLDGGDETSLQECCERRLYSAGSCWHGNTPNSFYRGLDTVFPYRRSVSLIQVMNHLARAAEQDTAGFAFARNSRHIQTGRQIA